jgi:ArsR family transcriptional regulator
MNTSMTLLDTLADPNRLAIVRLLATGEKCVCDVSEALGISNALASHHIKKLREVDLVSTERKGVWLHCRLNPTALLSLADELRALALCAADAPTGCCAPIAKEETA